MPQRVIISFISFVKRVRDAVLSRGVSSLIFARLWSAEVNLLYPMRISRSLARTPKCFCKTLSVSLLSGPEVPEVFRKFQSFSGSSGDSPEVPLCVQKFRTLSGSSGHLSCNGYFLGVEYKQTFFHLPTVAAAIHFDLTPGRRLEGYSKPFKAFQSHPSLHPSIPKCS